MKKLLIIFLLLPVLLLGQTTEELDFITPFHDGVAAVKKGNFWGFINEKGHVIIDFRDDLVSTEINGYKYPIFKNNRCLISEVKNGIIYFGYIDKTGKTVIEPKFLNAQNFDSNKTLALHLLKEELGNNEVLGKNVVNYRYYEVTIDIDGTVENYLNPKGTNIVLDKKFIRTLPEITSKQISDNLYAVKVNNNKWKLVSVEY
ncbi:WG repeat-containing protein [Litoribaculum gwangyangense]|uniref:WG repeat-containing protein n=1 Tax=Litoribaculum gwangyangense TaxID=1130722 RepID=A0ABP9CKV7_9FLAO